MVLNFLISLFIGTHITAASISAKTPVHTSSTAVVSDIPPKAKIYIPMLKTEIASRWPTLSNMAVLAGQIEAETCITLTRPGCWDPHTELKTSYEYGFGLGQITVTASMNTFTSLGSLDPTFKSWKWENRYDPEMQLRALVAMDLQDYRYFKSVASEEDGLAMMLSSYNGGPGSVILDIKYCQALANCDHTKWFGNVADHSHKSTLVRPGYGRSPYEINREYVDGILHNRIKKYVPYVDGG